MASRIAGNVRPLRLLSPIMTALFFAAVAGSVHAANNCPWINEATASGLLGGGAVGAFSAASQGQPATCKFLLQTAGGTRTLTIAVTAGQDAHSRVVTAAKGCKQAPEVLPAIGNEAYICTTEYGRQAVAEQVVGRVRDQVFTIVIRTVGKGSTVLNLDDLKSQISTATEQVSGNLF